MINFDNLSENDLKVLQAVEKGDKVEVSAFDTLSQDALSLIQEIEAKKTNPEINDEDLVQIAPLDEGTVPNTEDAVTLDAQQVEAKAKTDAVPLWDRVKSGAKKVAKALQYSPSDAMDDAIDAGVEALSDDDNSVSMSVQRKLGKLSKVADGFRNVGNLYKDEHEYADESSRKDYTDTLRSLVIDDLGFSDLKFNPKTEQYGVVTKEGEFKLLDDNLLKTVIGEVGGDVYEIIGGLAGAKVGAKAPGLLKVPAVIAGGMVGAGLGAGADTLKGILSTGQKLSAEQFGKEIVKGAVIDGAGSIIAPLVLKGVVAGVKGAYQVPKAVSEKIYRHVVNGNLDGAKKILKSDLGVDDAYMDDAVKQMQGWQKEVVDGEVNLVENAKNIMGAENKKEALNQLAQDAADNLGNAQAKEELLATAMKHPQGKSMLEGALTANPEGALRLQESIDARAKQAFDMLDAANGTEVKNSVKGYEGRVKAQYGDMRDTFTEAFKESDYRFDLDDLKIQENISSMGERIGDDYARKQFEAMSKAVDAQINGTRNGAGVTRNIDDLLDLWQKMNKFYGKNANKLDKPDAEVFVKIKKDIGAEVDRALEEHTTPEIAKQLRTYFDDARDAYTKMYEVRDTQLYKELMSEGKSASDRVDALLKHAKDDDGELQKLLTKLSPEEAGRAEDAIIDAVLKKYTKGKHDELKAIDMAKALDDLDALSPFFKSDASKKSVELLKDLHGKFRHDFALSGTIEGVRNGQVSTGIATTWQGKLEAHTAGRIFNYISTLMPIGANPKRLALQRHLASALRKSRTPLDMAKYIVRSKALPLDKRTELKELIKIHNRALAAENKTKAEAVEAELKAFEAKVEKKRLDKVLEVEEFVKPDITELRAMEALVEDDRYGSFSQLVRRIQDGKANEVDIRKYLEAKRNINKESLARGVKKERMNVLPQKYRDVGEEEISKLQEVSEFTGEEFNSKKVKRLLYDLKKNGVPRSLDYDALYDDMIKAHDQLKPQMDEANVGIKSSGQSDEILGSDGNPLFMKGIDHLLAGGVAGVEVDENGNISLDPEKFIMGMGGYAAAKAMLKNKRVQQEVKDLVLFGLEKFEKKLEGGVFDARAFMAPFDDSGIGKLTGIPQEIETFGRNFAKYKSDPKGAIEKLMKEKSGQVRGALYHPDIGEIDLVWGKVLDADGHTGYGLAHIIDKHGEEVAKRLDDIVMGGKVIEQKGNRVVLSNADDESVIALQWDKKDKHFVITAYERTPEGQISADAPAVVGESGNLSPKANSSIAKSVDDVKKESK